jgi:hypothetical protein
MTYQEVIGIPPSSTDDGYYQYLIKENVINWLEWAIENSDKVEMLTLDEMHTLMNMLKSKDPDNLYMGLEIIKNKLKENESNI